MAEAIIFDDGGSTRIKQIKTAGASGKLNDLIDVLKDVATGPLKKITITCLDEDGAARLPTGASAGTFPLTLGGPGAVFTIASGDHRVEGSILAGDDCLIQIKSVAASVVPIVEGRHAKGQSRYIVSNAPPIDEVTVKLASGTTKTFKVPTAAPKILYTAVIVSG
jgi:hypothetical protein